MPRQATWSKDGIENFRELVNMDLNPIKFLSIDPGKYNGVCAYDEKYYLQMMHVVDAEDIVPFLGCFDQVKTLVMEDYRVYSHRAQQHINSKLETVRVIGRVEGWAAREKVQLVQQPASIKPTGYAWIGEKPPAKSTNRNDPMDAHVHFMYWAVRHGKINAADLLRKPKV